MPLTVRDVAQLCGVSENRVFEWVQEGGLPAEHVNGVYRVNPTELLEWATIHKHHVSPAIFGKLNGDSTGHTILADALAEGGVLNDVPGIDRETVLTAAIETLPVPVGFDREALVRLLVAREELGGTAIGNGIAIPHPRCPVALAGAKRVIRLCYLTHPLDFGSPDGKPVDTLFLMICPTVRDHLQQLARLAVLLRDESFLQVLRDKPSRDVILKEVRRVEMSFHGNTYPTWQPLPHQT
jgi:PTS system nitrogen regulatory IIA component